MSTHFPLVNCQHEIQDIAPKGGKSFIVANLISQDCLEERGVWGGRGVLGGSLTAIECQKGVWKALIC